MSGTSGDTSCPICGENMTTYADWKPFDTVFGECFNCGFTYYTKMEQMDLEEINDRRETQNEDMGYEKNDKEYLGPLKAKDLKKWAKAIKSL